MNVENESPKCSDKSTPPANRKVRNPFDRVLIGHLHKPICSPGMCKIYKKKCNGFHWDIDQACELVPADITPCNSQFEPSPDPALERIVEDASERFFSQEMVIPSPLESSKKVKPLIAPYDASLQITSVVKQEAVVMKNVSAQTVLTLPPQLPQELEQMLQKYCIFTQEQNISDEYEITANGSLCRKLMFEEHSDMEHYDSEQTDDEVHIDKRPKSRYEHHSPVVFSPDLSRDIVSTSMKRTFGTPLNKYKKSNYRNKILDVVDFGEPCFSPIQFKTPVRSDQSSVASSFASASISPVTKTISDEDKNNFTSPESDEMVSCVDYLATDADKENKRLCYNRETPEKSILKRSASLKDSPPRSRKGSLSEKRSLSMSSLHRSRSCQKLDFSMDVSMEGSAHNHSQADSESSPTQWQLEAQTWSLVDEPTLNQQFNTRPQVSHNTPSIQIDKIMHETPIKGKCKSTILSHEISKIRAPASPTRMSLDASSDGIINSLDLENKKIDFNNVDLKLLSEVSRFDYTANVTKTVSDSSTSFKRVDSGYNENTFCTNASSYYESAIKPSELTVTNVSKADSGNTALKEITNVNWMRVDSGFKDENSADNVQFYYSENSLKTPHEFVFSAPKYDDKENDFDKFLLQTNKSEAMSISDIFTDDLTFNCNFSSTPSKSKGRKCNS